MRLTQLLPFALLVSLGGHVSAEQPAGQVPTTIRIPDLSFATVMIENEWGGTGTGFLVGRERDATTDKVILVTNKHVLSPDPAQRARATQLKLLMNVSDPAGVVAGVTITHPLHYSDGRKNWFEHPDRDVDVLAVDVTNVFVGTPSIAHKYLNYSLFVFPSSVRALGIAAGDELVILGYPLGLRHRHTNFPLVRSAILSTHLGEELEDEVKEGTVLRKRVLRGFLFDGGSIPGSSGSPVFLRPTDTRYINGALVVGPTTVQDRIS